MINLDLRRWIKMMINHYRFNMDTVINIFAGIGVLATVIALYYFAKDQYAIWEMNTYDRLKKKFNNR